MQCSVHCARHVAFYEAEYLQAATAATTSDGHCSNSDTIDSHCNEHDPDCSNNSDPLCSNSSDSSDLSPMNAEEEWGYTSGFWLDSTVPVHTFTGTTTTYTPPKSVCRQCPEYKGPHPARDGTTATGIATAAATAVGKAVAKVVGMVTGGTGDATKDDPQPSTSTSASTSTGASTSTAGDGEGSGDGKSRPDAKLFPTPPAFTCTPYQTHILCCCCLQPMPDRHHVVNFGIAPLPPQQCAVCSRAFCHAYWGCHKGDCMGCIGKFGDMNFGKRSLTGLILDNVYESEVFKQYLEMKGWSVRDVLRKCLEKLEAKEYSCPDQNRFRIDSAQVLCYACGLRNFKELAYQLRRDIPPGDLPDAVTRRHNCYWGRNCRTARNKPHHAQNFNHICDQTRTST